MLVVHDVELIGALDAKGKAFWCFDGADWIVWILIWVPRISFHDGHFIIHACEVVKEALAILSHVDLFVPQVLGQVKHIFDLLFLN